MEVDNAVGNRRICILDSLGIPPMIKALVVSIPGKIRAFLFRDTCAGVGACRCGTADGPALRNAQLGGLTDEHSHALRVERYAIGVFQRNGMRPRPK